jgi:hypothetical protein
MRRMQFACFATVTVAVLFAGALAWKAEATPLTGSVEPLVMTKGITAAENASCMFGTTRCAAGTKWMCVKGTNAHGDTKKCKCRAC